MTVEYFDAPEVDQIVRRLVPLHHGHLAGERIRCVFRSKHAKEGTKAILGKARRISGLNAYLSTDEGADAETYFVIEIALDIWRGMSNKEREALVDHELSHCRIKYSKTGEPSLVIAPHDLEEFNAIVERHGLWRRDVKDFLAAAQGQLRLVDEPSVVDEQTEDVA